MELGLYLCSLYIYYLLCISSTALSSRTKCRPCTSNGCTEYRNCIQGYDKNYTSTRTKSNSDSCPETCVNCEIPTGICTRCRTGFFGSHCMDICEGCLGDLCEQETGYCLKGCGDGYYNYPYCNTTDILHDDHDHHHHQYHHRIAQITKKKEERKSRKLVIWKGVGIGAGIVAVVVAVAVLIWRSRDADTKSSRGLSTSERVTEQRKEESEKLCEEEQTPKHCHGNNGTSQHCHGNNGASEQCHGDNCTSQHSHGNNGASEHICIRIEDYSNKSKDSTAVE